MRTGRYPHQGRAFFRHDPYHPFERPDRIRNCRRRAAGPDVAVDRPMNV
jgi:hypothetical protein